MKETNSLKYTQKNMIVGNKMRSVIIINKRPGTKLTSAKKVGTSTSAITRKKCGGCSRKRRG